MCPEVINDTWSWPSLLGKPGAFLVTVQTEFSDCIQEIWLVFWDGAQVSACCRYAPRDSYKAKHRRLGSIPEWLTQMLWTLWLGRFLLWKISPMWFKSIPKSEKSSQLRAINFPTPSGDYLEATNHVKWIFEHRHQPYLQLTSCQHFSWYKHCLLCRVAVVCI